jgi:hypothetical protein
MCKGAIVCNVRAGGCMCGCAHTVAADAERLDKTSNSLLMVRPMRRHSPKVECAGKTPEIGPQPVSTCRNQQMWRSANDIAFHDCCSIAPKDGQDAASRVEPLPYRGASHDEEEAHGTCRMWQGVSTQHSQDKARRLCGTNVFPLPRPPHRRE